MDKLVSDESLRRALSALAPSEPKRCDEARRAACALQLSETAAWMDAALSESTREVLRTAWILDIDTTVALANKNARIIWALLIKDTTFHPNHASTAYAATA